MRTLLLALAALSIPLAGCASEAEPVAPASEEVILVTDQNDVESLANESFMMAAHQHDYWGGKERLTVMEYTLANEACCMTLGRGGFDLAFAPEDGVVVPHGTARVEVTVTWTDSALSLYEDPELWVQTAAEHEPTLVGPIASGETLVVDAEDADLDLPHQSLSAWRFVLWLKPKADGVMTLRSGGQLTLFAEAVRGREIPVYPPHPDLWEGKDAIPLFDDAQPHAVWSGVVDEEERGYSCLRGCWPKIHRVVNGTVVPFDAAMVEVVLDARPEPGFDFGLKFHGSDTRTFTDLAPTSEEGTVRVYHIPVLPGLGDSPYASQSVWGFAVFSEKPERDGWFSGSYTLTARVLREAV